MSSFNRIYEAKSGKNQFTSNYAEVVEKANVAIRDLIDSYNKLDTSNK